MTTDGISDNVYMLEDLWYIVLSDISLHADCVSNFWKMTIDCHICGRVHKVDR